MKTINKVEIEAIFCDYIPFQKDMSENKIYISRMYMTASHLCLCGCGHLSVTPLCGNNWVFEYDNNKLSMQPSILNNNCPNKSHYIITKNKANFV